jgi:hypothetical protein
LTLPKQELLLGIVPSLWPFEFPGTLFLERDGLCQKAVEKQRLRVTPDGMRGRRAKDQLPGKCQPAFSKIGCPK